MDLVLLVAVLLCLGCWWWWRVGERAARSATERPPPKKRPPNGSDGDGNGSGNGNDGDGNGSGNAKRLGDAISVTGKPSERAERVDCSSTTRYCAIDDDCSAVCLSFRSVRFACDPDEHTCKPEFIKARDDGGDGGGGDDETVRCDTKNGEFAHLIGIDGTGTALWRCVQMYQHFADRSKFCEGGTFDMNAELRAPSYRDCTCPDGTVRAVYKMATQYDVGLPHCITRSKWSLYSENMSEL